MHAKQAFSCSPWQYYSPSQKASHLYYYANVWVPLFDTLGGSLTLVPTKLAAPNVLEDVMVANSQVPWAKRFSDVIGRPWPSL